jgi:hypothetical protein
LLHCIFFHSLVGLLQSKPNAPVSGKGLECVVHELLHSLSADCNYERGPFNPETHPHACLEEGATELLAKHYLPQIEDHLGIKSAERSVHEQLHDFGVATKHGDVRFDPTPNTSYPTHVRGLYGIAGYLNNTYNTLKSSGKDRPVEEQKKLHNKVKDSAAALCTELKRHNDFTKSKRDRYDLLVDKVAKKEGITVDRNMRGTLKQTLMHFVQGVGAFSHEDLQTSANLDFEIKKALHKFK